MRVSFYTSWQTQCGIADYNRRLVGALQAHAEVQIVREPLSPRGVGQDWPMYYRLGQAMNTADVGHVHHAHSFWGGRSPLRNALSLFLSPIRIPLVMTVHDVFGGSLHGWDAAPRSNQGQGLRRVVWQGAALTQRLWLRRVFQHLRVLIVHSAEQRHALLQAGATPAQIRVIPHLVHEVAVAPRAQARASLGFEEQHLVLTLFGFPTPRKGFATAIEALAHLPPHTRLLLAGGATLPAHEQTLATLHRLAEERGVADRFQVTGYLSEAQLAMVWGTTDMVLVPALEATGSGSLATAIATARPIIASDLPTHREINSHQPCLHLVPPGDPQALAAAIERVAYDSGYAQALTDGCQAYGQAFSATAIASTLATLYQTIVDHPGGPCARSS